MSFIHNKTDYTNYLNEHFEEWKEYADRYERYYLGEETREEFKCDAIKKYAKKHGAKKIPSVVRHWYKSIIVSDHNFCTPDVAIRKLTKKKSEELLEQLTGIPCNDIVDDVIEEPLKKIKKEKSKKVITGSKTSKKITKKESSDKKIDKNTIKKTIKKADKSAGKKQKVIEI